MRRDPRGQAARNCSAARRKTRSQAPEPTLAALFFLRSLLIAEKLGEGLGHAVATSGALSRTRRETMWETPSGPIVTP